MTFPGVSQLESNDYFPPLAKNRIAFGHLFFNLFSIIAFWYARKMRAVILYNLREKSAANLKFWWSYGNFSPIVLTICLRRVPLECWTSILSQKYTVGDGTKKSTGFDSDLWSTGTTLYRSRILQPACEQHSHSRMLWGHAPRCNRSLAGKCG